MTTGQKNTPPPCVLIVTAAGVPFGEPRHDILFVTCCAAATHGQNNSTFLPVPGKKIYNNNYTFTYSISVTSGFKIEIVRLFFPCFSIEFNCIYGTKKIESFFFLFPLLKLIFSLIVIY